MSKEHVTGTCSICHTIAELVYFELEEIYICIDCLHQIEFELPKFELDNDSPSQPYYPWDYLDRMY